MQLFEALEQARRHLRQDHEEGGRHRGHLRQDGDGQGQEAARRENICGEKGEFGGKIKYFEVIYISKGASQR